VSKSTVDADESPKGLARILDAGCFRLDPVAHAPLLTLAKHFHWVKRELGGLVWPDDILTQRRGTVKDCEAWIRAHEGFNTAFCQKARQQVVAEAGTCATTFFVNLAKGCHQVDRKAEPKPDWYKKRYALEKPEKCREYVHVPAEVSPTDADFAEIRALVAEEGKGVANIRAALAGKKVVSANSLAILREIRRLAEKRGGRPNYETMPTDEWLAQKAVQIHLDERVINKPFSKTFRDALEENRRRSLAGEGKPSPSKYGKPGSKGWDADKASSHDDGLVDLPLRISNPIPGQPAILVPVRMHRRVMERYQDAAIRTVCIEIGKGMCKVRLVVGKDDTGTAELAIPAGSVLVADDKGLCNTETFGVFRTPVALDEAAYAELAAKGKDECRQRFQTHELPAGFETLYQEVWSGSGFIGRMSKCESEIALVQKEIAAVSKRGLELRRCVNRHLGKGDDVPLDENEAYDDPLLGRLRKNFLGGRTALTRLIERRKALRQRMAGIKASWLGHLANRIVWLAKEMKAVAIVMERLTYTTGEKGAKDYKGKAMARKINWAARGQLEDLIEEKAAWNGLRVLFSPSYYTSCTCIDHGKTHKSYRRGHVFSCPVCGQTHADANATRTTCGSLFLRPKASILPELVRNTTLSDAINGPTDGCERVVEAP